MPDKSSFGSLTVSTRLPCQNGFQLIFAVGIEAHASHTNATGSPLWKGEIPGKGSFEWKDFVTYRHHQDHTYDNWTFTHAFSSRSYLNTFIHTYISYILHYLERRVISLMTCRTLKPSECFFWLPEKSSSRQPWCFFVTSKTKPPLLATRGSNRSGKSIVFAMACWDGNEMSETPVPKCTLTLNHVVRPVKGRQW